MALPTLSVKDATGQLKTFEVHQDVAGNMFQVVTRDSSAQTYRFSASFTPYATGAVTVLSIKGSATKTVRVKRIAVGGVSTAAGSSVYALQRTSSAGTGGTAVTPTAAKNDTASAAATAVVTHYTTAAQSAGVAVGGPLATRRMGTSIVTLPTTGAVSQYTLFPDDGAMFGQALVLRGTADFIELQNINAGNLPAGTVLEYTVELEEDAS